MIIAETDLRLHDRQGYYWNKNISREMIYNEGPARGEEK